MRANACPTIQYEQTRVGVSTPQFRGYVYIPLLDSRRRLCRSSASYNNKNSARTTIRVTIAATSRTDCAIDTTEKMNVDSIESNTCNVTKLNESTIASGTECNCREEHRNEKDVTSETNDSLRCECIPMRSDSSILFIGLSDRSSRARNKRPRSRDANEENANISFAGSRQSYRLDAPLLKKSRYVRYLNDCCTEPALQLHLMRNFSRIENDAVNVFAQSKTTS